METGTDGIRTSGDQDTRRLVDGEAGRWLRDLFLLFGNL